MTPSEIKEIQDAGLISYEKINSGTINQNFLVKTKLGKWILRVNNPSVLGINREHEALILNAIEPLNISPKVIINNLQQNYLIMEFIPQNKWDDQDCINIQHNLIETLSKAHQLDLSDELPDFSFRLQQYHDHSKHLTDNDFKLIHQNTIQTLKNLGFFKINQLIHFDLNKNNLLGKCPLSIIDWEFASCGHPIFDLAIFIHYQQLIPEQCEEIALYCSGFDYGDEILKHSLDLVKQMFLMWHAAFHSA